MAPIRQLPARVVNQIAAGEVIERPASLVKELMENSVDAQTTRIDVSIEGGGIELVRVSDTGSGIPGEELPLAVASHATSKLRSADDLFCVSTLGFRGEALASIASVSHMTVRSRTAQSPAGSQIGVAGGQIEAVVPCGCPAGTTVEVRNLFFNTPVRRKFLRTPATELSHCTEAFTRIALAHPAIHLTLSHNGRTLYDLPAGDEWRGRIARFFGEEVANDLLAVSGSDGEIRLTGYVASPSHSRSNPRMQYLLLNGRAIRDRSLQHALGEAYRGLLMTGRYPICFLRLEMPPQAVDVNVHPTKAEVRFADSGRLYRHLLSTLRSRFLSTDLTAQYRAEGSDHDIPAGRTPAAEPSRPHTLAAQPLDRWASRQLDQPSLRAAFSSEASGPAAPPEPTPAEFPAAADFPAAASGAGFSRRGAESLAAGVEPSVEARQAASAAGSLSTEDRRGRAVRALQVHDRYLVAECDEGVIVFDQHALHERILYEQLRRKLAGGSLERQGLLMPEPVDLTPSEVAAALEHVQLLAQLGLEIQPFGGNTIVIHAYPALLQRMKPSEVLRDLVEQLTAGSKLPDRRDLLERLLQRISCRSAVKAGDRLTDDEIGALLEQRHVAQDSHHCPHGRPTSLVLTREDLDRQFKRT